MSRGRSLGVFRDVTPLPTRLTKLGPGRRVSQTPNSVQHIDEVILFDLSVDVVNRTIVGKPPTP